MIAPAAVKMATQPSILDVVDLKTYFFIKAGIVRAVDGVSFTVAPGEVLGILGESGSGKSVTAQSILGLIDPPGRIVSGKIEFAGRDLATAAEDELREIRGRRISMIFQDPMTTFNPVLRIETQMTEAILTHRPIGRSAARALARDSLARMGIASAERWMRAYPHQLSGGMRQRVTIAIAFVNKPELVIADEPTAALDATIQAQLLHEIQTLCRQTEVAMIWISHDLAVVSALADRIAVMYAGSIVEQGRAGDLLSAPLHPYTKGLLRSLPITYAPRTRLPLIPGTTPSLINPPLGCRFRERCSRAGPECSVEPPIAQFSGNREVRCWRPHREERT